MLKHYREHRERGNCCLSDSEKRFFFVLIKLLKNNKFIRYKFDMLPGSCEKITRKRIGGEGRLRTAMSSSRGRAAKRSLSRVGLYDPVCA